MNARMIIWVIDCFIIQQGRASFKPFVSFAAYVKYERSYSSSTKTTPSSLTTRESHSASPLYSPLHAHGDRRHSSVNASTTLPQTENEWRSFPYSLPLWAVQNVILNLVAQTAYLDVVPLPTPLSWAVRCWTQCCVPCELRSLGRGSLKPTLVQKVCLL